MNLSFRRTCGRPAPPTLVLSVRVFRPRACIFLQTVSPQAEQPNLEVSNACIGCFNPFEIEFNTPFTLRVLLSGSANAIGFPGSLTGYRAGAGNFDISNVQVRQGGLLVDGADLVAVPEPATWFLPGLGLAVVAAYRQRRR